MKVYIPTTDYECVVVQNEQIIRAYIDMPKNNQSSRYVDYYPKMDYYFREGEQNFSSYTTLPTCLNSSILTSDFYYRIDFSNILIMFFIMSFFCFYLPIKLFSKLFRRFL